MTCTTDNCDTDEPPTVQETAEALVCIARDNLLNLGLSELEASAELIRGALAMLPEDECGECLALSVLREFHGHDADEAIH